MTIVDSWREKGDRELEIAAEQIDNYTEEEKRLIRAELIRRGMPEPQHKARKRSTLLNIVLGYFIVGNLYVAYRNAEIYWDLVSHGDPNQPHLPYLAFSILSMLIVISIIGLWFWKKWGFYLFLACQILSIFVAFFLVEANGLSQVIKLILVGSIGPAIFLVVIRQKWDCFD